MNFRVTEYERHHDKNDHSQKENQNENPTTNPVISPNDNVVEISPTSRIDSFTATKFDKAISELMDSGWRKLVINLSETPFIDSAGISVLVGVMRRARQLGAKIRMIWPQAKTVKRVMQMMKLDMVFEMYDSSEAAIEQWND
ncbi:MAG: STAS domain-containing protein [Chloroflexota bacterium]